jgi:hypothetical protein
MVTLGHCRACTDSRAALAVGCGKWLQSIDARYLAFLTDQLLDYARSTSLPLHVLRFCVLAAG